MIIDHGFDLLLLAKEHLFRDPEKSPLLAIALTGNMQYFGTEVIDENFNGCLDDYTDAILAAVDTDLVRYFAVAHETETARHEWIDFEGTARLKSAARERGLHLIGELFVDSEYWCSTGPMGTLELYHDDDLPRISVRRPRHFAKTRMAGGGEYDPPDNSFNEKFGYEIDEEIVRRAGAASGDARLTTS